MNKKIGPQISFDYIAISDDVSPLMDFKEIRRYWVDVSVDI